MVSNKAVKRTYIIFTAILIVGLLINLWPQYMASNALQNYKGDEVWYVDAARNYLYHGGITVHYRVTETWYEGDIVHHKDYEGVNVFVRIPDNVTGIDPKWYDWSKFDPYVYNIIVQNNLTGIHAQDWNEINYGRYYLVPADEFDTFVNAIKNVRADKDITVTYQVIENGKPVEKTVTLFKKGDPIFDVRPGFMYADKWGIEKYYNLEHPFLGKVFIISAMYLFGDVPTYWRIPSLIMYYIVLIFVGLTVVNITKRYFWGAVAMLLVAIDPGLRMLGTTAMLDIYVAAFMALTVYALSKKDIAAAALFTGLAAAVKLNGAFVAAAIAIYVLLKANSVGKNTKEKVKVFIKDGIKYTIIWLSAFIIGNIPILAFLSLREWWEGLINGAKWMASRGVVPHPFQSPIWNWFFNKNPFTIYFNPRIMIQTNWFMWDLAVIFAILGLFLIYRKYGDKYLLPVLGGFSIIGMYILMYIIGGKTQYSYYGVQITPFMIVMFTVGLAVLIDWNRLLKAFKGTIFEDDVRNAVPDGIELEE